MRQPWLPAERMILKSGAPVIGYTLASDHDWTVVLSASSRTIKYIPTHDVLARRVCDITPDGSVTHPPSPLVPLLHAQAVELPSCSGRGSAGNFSSSLDMQV